MRLFLHNGVCFRSDLIPSLLSMVQELKMIIKRQASYRFYSSSLLIIYDGAVIPQTTSHESQGPVATGKELKLGLNRELNCKEDGYSVLTNRSIERQECQLELDSQTLAVPEKMGETDLPLEESTSPTKTMRNTHTCNMSDLMHVNPTTPFRLQHKLAHDLHPYHAKMCSDHHCRTNVANTGTTEVARDTEDSLRCEVSIAQESNLVGHTKEIRPLSDSSSHNRVKNGYHHDNHHLPHHDDHGLRGSVDLEDARQLVDLRMIDFAHSTHSGYDDAVQYVGPDEGYVIGLTSLVACFEQMLESTS